MEFTVICSKVNPIFGQAIKTCAIKSGTTDGDFLIKESNGNLWVTSINDRAEQTILIPTESLVSEGEESFFVNGQSLTELFKQFPDEEVICTYSGNLFVAKGTVRDVVLEFPTKPACDFASIQFIPDGNKVVTSGRKFRESLKLTSFAASTESSEGSLVAVHFVVSGDTLFAESSDNNRVAVSRVAIEDVGANIVDFLLPKETSDILMGLLERVDSLKIENGKRTIKFSWDNTVFVSKLISNIDDEFPDLKQYTDGHVVASIEISRQELLNSLKLVGLLARDAHVVLKCSKEGLRVSANAKDRGAGSNLIEPQLVKGSAKTMVPYKYLLGVSNILDAAWISIDFIELASDATGLHICVKDGDYNHFIFAAADLQDEQNQIG